MGSLSDDKIRHSLEDSLHDLGLEKVRAELAFSPFGSRLDRPILPAQVNVFYSHGPDRETPLLHLVSEMDKLHKEGKFNEVSKSGHRVLRRGCREPDHPPFHPVRLVKLQRKRGGRDLRRRSSMLTRDSC